MVRAWHVDIGHIVEVVLIIPDWGGPSPRPSAGFHTAPRFDDVGHEGYKIALAGRIRAHSCIWWFWCAS